eukprot:jgi/Orpsp1_1/1176637/evm.model.c7180000058398.1
MKLENALFILYCASSTLALTTKEVVKKMGLGWNLGNTLEACGEWINGKTTKQYETAWGNPETTEDMIKGVKSYGFNTVRIPVAWSNLMAENYTINPMLLKRVEEVVNYVVKNDMYAIMNIHWDSGWFEKFATSENEAFTKYKKIWGQLTEYFKGFDEHLIFESLNEEGCWDTIWNRYSKSGDKNKAYSLLNTINQEFVNIVRQSGGNNTNRHLLLAGYCTDIDLTVDQAYVVPKDDKVIVSVHYYTPSTFTLLEEDADWGKASRTWGTDSEVNALKNDFNKLKTRFVDNGIPVIIGEYGTTTTNKETDSIHKYLRTCAEVATSLDMCPVVWDAGQYFDRNALTFKDPEVGEIYKSISSKLNVGNSSASSGSNSGSNNNNETSTCWSEPDYPCCKNTCKVFYTDDSEWGVENGDWCGIPSTCKDIKNASESCPDSPDYPCCNDCNVILTEDNGSRWGVLNNDWCSIKNSC